MEPLRSVDDTAPDDAGPSKWTMRVYSSKETLTDMPKLSWLDFVGQEIVPAIDFRNQDDFRQVCVCVCVCVVRASVRACESASFGF